MMTTTFKAAVFGLFTLVAANAQANEHQHEGMMTATPAAEQTQAISSTGIVKAIDMENKKITISHDPIPSVNWPAMTMRFTLTPQTQLGDIKVGDKVAFNFVQQGNLSLLQDINVSQ